jgi:uncharacterized membrane protein YbhN (UPF0104 family)
MGSRLKFFPEKKRLPYLKVLQWMIVIAIFAFMGKMVWDNWGEVKGAHFSLKSFPLLWATLIFIFSYFIQIWAWYLITLKLGIALSFRETVSSWFYSQSGKYLPGKVWLLLSRFYLYASKGKSKKAISVALYFEIVSVVMAAELIFLASLIFFREIQAFHTEGWVGWLVLLFFLALIFLHPRVLQKILNWILVLLRKEPITLSISYLDILWILSVSTLSWIIGGIGFYLFVDAIFHVPLSHILFLAGALAFSSILGLIAIFAPGGLGVREGALVYLLSYVMPGSVAVIISILARLWMTLIEIGLIGMIYLLGQFRKR